MNNKVPIIIALLLIVGAGVWAVARSHSSSTNTNGNAQTNTDQQNANAQGSTDNGNTNTVTDQPATSDCTRSFDENILKTAKVETANKFVTLDVRGYGKIKVELYDKDAPKTVENFLRLTNANYYNCITFHRVAKGFVIQTGDPTATGSGGDSAFGGEFADELNPNTASYKTGYVKGVLAMANRGPNTNTSQFFITLADVNSALQKNYTIFGKVVEGADVVDKIGQVDIGPVQDGKPLVPVVIDKATITNK